MLKKKKKRGYISPPSDSLNPLTSNQPFGKKKKSKVQIENVKDKCTKSNKKCQREIVTYLDVIHLNWLKILFEELPQTRTL
jgi:hypothetical protein